MPDTDTTKKYSYKGSLQNEQGDSITIQGRVESTDELFDRLKMFSGYEVVELELLRKDVN